VGHVIWLLFGPGAWGTGGNLVAAVILGVPAAITVFRRLRAHIRVGHIATTAHVRWQLEQLREDLAVALQAIHGLDDDHEALAALRPARPPADPKGM
jgi:hypothetical protein